jgi:hypothetical protein
MTLASPRVRVLSLLVLSAGALAGAVAPACTSFGTVPPIDEPDEEEEEVTLRPGDVCVEPTAGSMLLRAQPARVFVTPCAGGDAACATRPVKLVLEPDVCDDLLVELESESPEVLTAPEPADGDEPASFGLYRASTTIRVHGASTTGTAGLLARVPQPDGTTAEARIEVVTLPADVPACEGTARTDALRAGDRLAAAGGASIALPEGANDPVEGSFLWPVEPFSATVACGAAAEQPALPTGYVALGPPVTFGPASLSFPRDVPMSVPINPARMPSEARGRHLEVMYSGPAFRAPRVVPVMDAHVVADEGGGYQLSFKAPRLGTYQAVVRSDAGTVKRRRRLTHRAVTGVSMGGIGSSMFGLRHHELFDVVAPLGGPGAWSWMIHHIERNHMGGFRPIPAGATAADVQLEKTLCDDDGDCRSDETCLGVLPDRQGRCTLMPAPEHPYEHPQTFDTWWAEYPRQGTGGRFPRSDYAQIFRDLALTFGNPNGDNLTPGAENLPAGVRPDDPSVVGDRDDDLCSVWVDPIDGDPQHDLQEQLAAECPAQRCANTLVLHDYYDAEFNPDGRFPVITVCDGTPTDEALSPWANTWKAEGPNDYPLEVALAVDVNENGVRDELEPIITAGHEPWDDTGPDGVASEDEEGYDPETNLDPAGDDYDPQYNPGGTERDHRYQRGEPFEDCGLDGVCGTKQQPAGGWQRPGDGYDVGEGDGVFTASRGLRNMWDRDPSSVVRRQSEDLPDGPLNDAALSRLDVWTDGGLRDLFNFHVAAQHFAGSFRARGRGVSYFSAFEQLPGQDPSASGDVYPSRIPWEDLTGVVLQRYGKIDPTERDIENGSGQHVGTVLEIASRLQTALYFIGSRWPEAELRSLVEPTQVKPLEGAPACEAAGTCNLEFTDSRGRNGPVTINFPPGYSHADQQDRRYPVIYLLHGYGQTPEDLGAAILFLSNWMNNPTDSVATRLPKAIVVYVDGRCRTDDEGRAECIRGSFYNDSPRLGGHLSESWWLELMDHVDATYRTMGESEVEWIE